MHLDGAVCDGGAEAAAAQSPASGLPLPRAEGGVCADGRWLKAPCSAAPNPLGQHQPRLRRMCRARTKRPAGLHERLLAAEQTADEHCRGH